MGKVLKRVFLAILLLGILFIGLPIAAGVGVVAVAYSAGTVVVDVDDGRGTDFTIPVPAGIVPLALRFMPSDVCRDLDGEVEANWPAVREAVDVMNQIPDAVLVQVDSGRDRVRVVKERGRVVVRVRSGDEKVNVSVPLHMVSSVVNQLDRVCF